MLYIHIPLCTAKCHYCSFYSLNVNGVNRENLLDALCREIKERAGEHPEPLDTIYFGGGTPSVLSKAEFVLLFNHIKCNYDTSKVQEITVEANPDHLTAEFLLDLRELGVNRLSIGTQSFNDLRLKTLGRRHTALDAVEAVQRAQRLGFENISIDLIFGFNDLDHYEWNSSITQALELGVQHISAYQLTIEEGSVFAYKGVECASDETSFEQYMTLCERLREADFEHYEISNFSLPGFNSKHNSGYWNGKKYIGIGPSAHSYDALCTRSWNISSLQKYNDHTPSTKEYLTADELHNEYIMTKLRQSRGFLVDEYYAKFKRELPEVKGLNVVDGRAFITEEDLFISDSIIAQLFI